MKANIDLLTHEKSEMNEQLINGQGSVSEQIENLYNQIAQKDQQL